MIPSDVVMLSYTPTSNPCLLALVRSWLLCYFWLKILSACLHTLVATMGRKCRSLTLKHFLPAKEGHGHFTFCRHCWEGEGKEDQLPDTIDDETAKKLPGVIQYKDKDGNTGSLGKHYGIIHTNFESLQFSWLYSFLSV